MLIQPRLPTTETAAAGELLLNLRSVYARAVVPSDELSRLHAFNELLPRLIVALDDADINSDCDFLMATVEPITPPQEAALRQMHRALFDTPGHWNQDLEGSYPPIDDLRNLEALGWPWLFINHGQFRVAHLWAEDALDPQWRQLIRRADEERARGWEPADLPDPETVEQTRFFADYATQVAAHDHDPASRSS